MPFPISFLADELKQNGIATDAPELLQHSALLSELSYALSPVMHEGKLQPYGFLVAEKNHHSVIKTTAMSMINCRVKTFEFDTGILSCEAPINPGLFLIASFLPSRNFSCQTLKVCNPSV